MEKKVFNFKFYEPALKELWEKRVPDIKIANVLGVCNTVISRYRRSFKLPFVVSNTKVVMSDDAIKQVFIKHNCCDFSEAVKYGGNSNAVLVQREVVNELDTRKLTTSDFFNPDTCQLALEKFVYYNLFAPRYRVIQYLDDLFIRYHKKPLSSQTFKSLYSKALAQYEKENGYAYRFAQPVFNGDSTLSEIFVVYLIVYFATKAKNKNCNPKFISKYCQFIYESGPIKQNYLAELYAVLGIPVRDDDYVLTDEAFKEERVLVNNKESNLFVPFPFMVSKNDAFALPVWASKKYGAWLSAQLSKSVFIPGVVQVDPSVIDKSSDSKEVITDTEEVITNEDTVIDVNSTNVDSKDYALDSSQSCNCLSVVQEMSVDKKRDSYFKSLIDVAVGFVSTEDYYLAASLLQIIDD